jgi:CubicO group peptidase (beta-lactamase class C family)
MRLAALAFPLFLAFQDSATAPASLPASAPSPATSRAEIRKRLDAVMEKAVAHGFSGSVLIVRGSDTLLEKGYGLADRQRKIPCAPDTVYDIQSITKQFTASAILKLEMQGKLAVGDPMDKYLPGVPNDKKAITLHHLLTHTAGFPSEIGDDYEAIRRDPYVERALAGKLRSEPGSKYHYSNVGYSLLAAIVERVSRQTYEAFLREQLLLPAGMEQTGYRLPKWRPDAIPHGYEKDKDWGTPLDHAWDTDGPYWNLLGNGGILTTAGDMLRWHRALAGETVLSADAKKKMFTPHVAEDAGGESHYGYGWVVVERSPFGRLLTHDGSNDVFFSDLLRFVDRDLFVFLATNSWKREFEKLGQSLAAAVLSP